MVGEVGEEDVELREEEAIGEGEEAVEVWVAEEVDSALVGEAREAVDLRFQDRSGREAHREKHGVRALDILSQRWLLNSWHSLTLLLPVRSTNRYDCSAMYSNVYQHFASTFRDSSNNSVALRTFRVS